MTTKTTTKKTTKTAATKPTPAPNGKKKTAKPGPVKVGGTPVVITDAPPKGDTPFQVGAVLLSNDESNVPLLIWKVGQRGGFLVADPRNVSCERSFTGDELTAMGYKVDIVLSESDMAHVTILPAPSKKTFSKKENPIIMPDPDDAADEVSQDDDEPIDGYALGATVSADGKHLDVMYELPEDIADDADPWIAICPTDTPKNKDATDDAAVYSGFLQMGKSGDIKKQVMMTSGALRFRCDKLGKSPWDVRLITSDDSDTAKVAATKSFDLTKTKGK